MDNTFNKFLWKCKIDISEFTADEEHFITLREPNTAEMKELSKIQSLLQNTGKEEEEAENVFEATDKFASACSTLIVDHNFFTEGEDPQKLPAKEIVLFMKSKIDLIEHVMEKYMTSLPLVQKNAKK